MELWGLVGYECFGQVVLPRSFSETFNIVDLLLEAGGIGMMLGLWYLELQ